MVALLIIALIVGVIHCVLLSAKVDKMYKAMASQLDEARQVSAQAHKIAAQVKGIASNALGSAQRAEDRIVKHTKSVNKQISEVIASVKTKQTNE